MLGKTCVLVVLKMVIILGLGFSINCWPDDRVTIQQSISYYDIEADGIDDFFQKIIIEGPRSGRDNKWAILRWDLNTEYYLDKHGDQCQFVIKEIAVIGEIIIPNWKNIGRQDAHLQRWWHEFDQYIQQHEKNHLKNVIDGAYALTEKIDALPLFEQCSKARNGYLDAKHTVFAGIRKQDVILDNATMRDFNSDRQLFKILKQFMPNLAIESGGMVSFISF